MKLHCIIGLLSDGEHGAQNSRSIDMCRARARTRDWQFTLFFFLNRFHGYKMPDSTQTKKKTQIDQRTL